MLTYNEFKYCVRTSVNQFNKFWLNDAQDKAVKANPFPPLLIIAGPGTGKTTVLALRVIKFILVDGLSPESIMATTFTRKASKEMRSRILSWGNSIIQEAKNRATAEGDINKLNWLSSLDINAVMTGTLDSLAEEMISEDRQPGEITPVIIETFSALSRLRRNIIFPKGLHANKQLGDHLNNINPNSSRTHSLSAKLSICESFASRVLQDGIDLVAYKSKNEGQKLLGTLVDEYHEHLKKSYLMDYALLEASLLEKLKNNRLKVITDKLQALLVDEFQDTNYVQEQIYYELCKNSNASLTVVGDDDQSIYRFRGATVEIFSDFNNRIVNSLGPNWEPRRIDLTDNYRSTERIVGLCNHFISVEPDYQVTRVPNKLDIVAAAPWAQDENVNIPVLGIFREELEEIADRLSEILLKIFRGNGFYIPIANGQTITLKKGVGGDLGDAVLLGHTANEMNNEGKPRLPLLMRKKMITNGENVFNPRGRDLISIKEVSQLLGLMLECIDPGGTVQKSIKTLGSSGGKIDQWRESGLKFARTNPMPGGLEKFIKNWGNRIPGNMVKWPPEWPLLELMFTLISWFPLFQSEPEGQVYLEAIARTIVAASQVSTYQSQILYYKNTHDKKSIIEAIWEIFVPIAEGSVQVNEDLMPYVPRNYLPIMTIHQAKGLEFPLVILDVGSDFKKNHPKQRRFRYPEKGDNVHHIEDHVAPYTPVGSNRLLRTHRQRAFDDLRRLYYVAKSRAQSALILVGRTQQIKTNSTILSVATGDLFSNTQRTYTFIPSTKWSPDCPVNTIALI